MSYIIAKKKTKFQEEKIHKVYFLDRNLSILKHSR